MTQSWPNKGIHQVFFAWSPHSGGHAIVAHSMSAHEVEMWGSRLGSHVRLQPVTGSKMPNKALSYLDFGDGRAAVLRRVNVGDSVGRNNAHVLIGDADLLDVERALEMEHWHGWQINVAPGTVMDVLTVQDLSGAGGQGNRRQEAAQVERALTTVLTRMIESPARPVSVLGCPTADRLPLVRALRQAGDRQLRSQMFASTWSFSTYEDRHNDNIPYLPHIVFLPELPPGGASRTVVDLRTDNSVSPVARQLVDRLLRGGSGTVVEEEPRREYVPEQPRYQHRNDVARRDPERVPNPRKAPDIATPLADQLLDAGSVEQLLCAFKDLAQCSPEDRVQLRKTLNVPALNRVAALVDNNITDELQHRLLVGLFGPQLQDLRNDQAAGTLAEEIVQNSNSERLARIMALAAFDNGHHSVVKTGFDRWTTSEHPPRQTKIGWTTRTARRLRKRWLVTTLAVLLGLALAVAVLRLGIWIGSPEVSQQISTPPQTTTPASETSSTARPQTGVVSLPLPSASSVVYGFMVIGDSYYPQQPCTPADRAGREWQCARISNPEPRDGAQPVLMAVVVPRTDMDRLAQASKINEPAAKGAGWGDPVLVPVG